MRRASTVKFVAAFGLAAVLAGCGGGGARTLPGDAPGLDTAHPEYLGPNRQTIWDIFRPRRTENTVQVNKYIWNAALEVLNFLPVQSIDPFTGVISTGYGTPPGGGRPYRATVYVSDPALEARSLKVALQSQSGPVAAATQRAVEDAILARARQLRAAAGRF